jgi:hypothetical protein
MCSNWHDYCEQHMSAHCRDLVISMNIFINKYHWSAKTAYFDHKLQEMACLDFAGRHANNGERYVVRSMRLPLRHRGMSVSCVSVVYLLEN